MFEITPHVWVDGESITSAKLNQLEDNIANAAGDFFVIVPSIQSGYYRKLKMTPRQLSEYNHDNKVAQFAVPGSNNSAYGIVSAPVCAEFHDSSDKYESILYRGTVEITDSSSNPDPVLIPMPLFGDRYNWVVTISHNSETKALEFGTGPSNYYCYYGTVGGSEVSIDDRGDYNTGRYNLLMHVSESGDYDLQILQSDGVTVIAPSQTITIEDQGWSGYDVYPETSTGYVIPYNGYSLSLSVEGEYVYDSTGSDVDLFTGNKYYIAAHSSPFHDNICGLTVINPDTGLSVPGVYSVVLKLTYSSDPRNNSPVDPEGQFSYMPVTACSSHYEFSVYSNNQNWHYQSYDPDTNYYEFDD